MSLFKNIKDGWTNYLNAFNAHKDSESGKKVDPKIERIARERAAICKECPELVKSGFFKLVNKIIRKPDGTKDEKKVLHTSPTPTVADESMWDGNTYKCGQCGCAFPANVYSPGKTCPMGKWDGYELETK